MELLFAANIFGNKLSIVNNLCNSYNKTYCLSDNLSKEKQIEIQHFDKLLYNDILNNIFGITPFTFDVYYIDDAVKHLKIADDINNYKKITVTHKNTTQDFLDGACINNTKLYVFKIEFKTNKNGLSILNPFIIKNKDVNKYQVVNKYDVCLKHSTEKNIGQLIDKTKQDILNILAGEN